MRAFREFDVRRYSTGAVGINNPFTMDFHQWDSFVSEVMKGEEMCDKNMAGGVGGGGWGG